MNIHLQGIQKRYGALTVLDGIDLTIREGELVALLGPSGSGKTSLLRTIAGFENPDAGHILFDEQDVTHVPIADRGIGFVFQHYALFRHMTVAENIAFGLSVKPKKERQSESYIQNRVDSLLSLIRLETIRDRYPHQLSGGQRQRVALARALAVEPSVLLLDEPFGALDAKVRKTLRRRLRELHQELGMTTVFVTHDQEEALDVADRVIILHEGKIVQDGSPQEVYEQPATPFVYDFLGRVNLFHGRIRGGKLHLGDGGAVSVLEAAETESDSEAVGFVRAHELEILREPIGEDSIPVVIKHVQMLGPIVRLELLQKGSDDYLEAELTREQFRTLSLDTGDEVWVKPFACRVFVPEDYSI
ncbi:MAG: sulfate/molybdate ABC transporter ATP-binding protein [Bacilli bacterium]